MFVPFASHLWPWPSSRSYCAAAALCAPLHPLCPSNPHWYPGTVLQHQPSFIPKTSQQRHSGTVLQHQPSSFISKHPNKGSHVLGIKGSGETRELHWEGKEKELQWERRCRSCSIGKRAAEVAVGKEQQLQKLQWGKQEQQQLPGCLCTLSYTQVTAVFVHSELHTGDSSIWAAEREGWREPPPAGHFPKHACSFLGILTTVCSSSSRRPSIPANTNPLCCIQRCREGTQGFGNCLESLQC